MYSRHSFRNSINFYSAVDVKEYAELVEGLSHQSNAIQLFVSGTDLDETAHPAKRLVFHLSWSGDKYVFMFADRH